MRHGPGRCGSDVGPVLGSHTGQNVACGTTAHARRDIVPVSGCDVWLIELETKAVAGVGDVTVHNWFVDVCI